MQHFFNAILLSVSNTVSMCSWKIITEKQVCSEKMCSGPLPSSFTPCVVSYVFYISLSVWRFKLRLLLKSPVPLSSGTYEVNLKIWGFGASSTVLTEAISRHSNWNQFTHKPQKTCICIRLLPVC